MRTVALALLLVACRFEPGKLSARDDAAAESEDAMTDAVEIPTDTPLDTNQPMDSAASLCVTSTCGSAGGSCVAGVCEIDNDTPLGVTCPSGMPCKVICDTVDACKGGVDCAGATSCDVTCAGTATCQNAGVDCGQAATCRVRCAGSSACQHGAPSNKSVECRDSTCSVTCTGSSSCEDGIDVDSGGTCASHCCDGGCVGGFDSCVNDNVCI